MIGLALDSTRLCRRTRAIAGPRDGLHRRHLDFVGVVNLARK